MQLDHISLLKVQEGLVIYALLSHGGYHRTPETRVSRDKRVGRQIHSQPNSRTRDINNKK